MPFAKDLLEQRKKELKEEVLIWNIDDEDFFITYNGENYKLGAGRSNKFPRGIAEHMRYHLATKVMNKRGVKFQTEEQRNKVYKEIDFGI